MYIIDEDLKTYKETLNFVVKSELDSLTMNQTPKENKPIKYKWIFKKKKKN